MWAAEIAAAVRSCSALALVFTPASVTSRNVQQQIQLAWDNDRPIVPLMLEAVAFPDEIAYFLQGRQWIDIDLDSSNSWTHDIARLLRLAPETRGEGPPATVRSAHFPTKLPVPPAPIFGKDDQIENTCSLLQQRAAPLITLVGLGGVGKPGSLWPWPGGTRKRSMARSSSSIWPRFATRSWLCRLLPITSAAGRPNCRRGRHRNPDYRRFGD